MQRRILCTAALLAGLTASGHTLAQPVQWDFATAYAAFNYHSKNNAEFVKEVEQKTQGSLKITPHFGASLFKMPEIKRAVQTGNAQMGEFFMASFQNEAQLFGVDGLPFLAASVDDAFKLYQAQKPALEKTVGQTRTGAFIFHCLAPARHLQQKAHKLHSRLKRLEMARLFTHYGTYW